MASDDEAAAGVTVVLTAAPEPGLRCSATGGGAESGTEAAAAVAEAEAGPGGRGPGAGEAQHVLLASRQLSTTKDVIISVREKHGSFRSAVPCMPMPMALVCCFLNLFLPGVGTLLSSFSLFCCGLTRMSTRRAFFWNLLAAILQTISSIFIVGWIWSISWGLTFCTLASEYQYEKQARCKHHKTARWSPT